MSLHPAATADQSRPTHERETKKIGSLLRKLTLKRSPRAANSVSIDENASVTSAMSSSPVTLTRKPSSRSFRRRQTPAIASPNSTGIMNWMENECPQDLIPRVLAFAGPQTAAALSRTCRFWKNVIDKESTWRTMCEELYKVRQLVQTNDTRWVRKSHRNIHVICSGRKGMKYQSRGLNITSSIHAFQWTFPQSQEPLRW